MRTRNWLNRWGVGKPSSLKRRLAEALLLSGLLLTASILKAGEPSAPPQPQTSQPGDEAVLFETAPPKLLAAIRSTTGAPRPDSPQESLASKSMT